MRQPPLRITTWIAWILFLSPPAFPTSLTPSQKMMNRGVASGDVTDSAAVIWAGADTDASLIVEYATTAEFSDVRRGGTMHVSATTDFTGTVTVTGLRPATRYYFRVRSERGKDTESDIGSFATAPALEQPRDVTFLWSGD